MRGLVTLLYLMTIGYVCYRITMRVRRAHALGRFTAVATYFALTVVQDVVFFGHWLRYRAFRRKHVDWDEELRKL